MPAYISLHNVSSVQVKLSGFRSKESGEIRNWTYIVDFLDDNGKLLSELNLFSDNRVPVLDTLLNAAGGDVVFWDVN